jgi:hypothetical protein
MAMHGSASVGEAFACRYSFRDVTAAAAAGGVVVAGGVVAAGGLVAAGGGSAGVEVPGLGEPDDDPALPGALGLDEVGVLVGADGCGLGSVPGGGLLTTLAAPQPTSTAVPADPPASFRKVRRLEFIIVCNVRITGRLLSAHDVSVRIIDPLARPFIGCAPFTIHSPSCHSG